MDKHKNVRNSIVDMNEIMQTIVIVSILVIGLSIIGYNLINRLYHKDTVLYEDEMKIWEKEFEEIEKNKIGVQFYSINTTEKEYGLLRVACNDFLQNIRTQRDLDSQIQTDVNTTEEEFVDIKEKTNKIVNNKIDNQNMVETGPVYFNDLILIRYINEDGALAIISSAFENEEKTEENIKLYKQNEIINIVDVIRERIKSNREVDNSNSITEDEYVENIINCIISVFEANDNASINHAIKESLDYFTYDGAYTLLKIKTELNITDTEIKNILSIAGKSDTSLTYKDRVYAQMKSKNGDDINMIIKLNWNLRVFDIDII